MTRYSNAFFHVVPLLSMEFIEYKPSMPTKAYIERFFCGFEEWKSMATEVSLEHASRTEAVIYYGSPYTKNRETGVGTIAWEGADFGWRVLEDDWGANSYEYALEYRFDLEQPCHA